MTQAEIARIQRIPCSVVRGYVDAAGKFTASDDSGKPYVLRRGRGLSTIAPLLRFSRVKPRYRRYRGVLAMVRSRKAA